MPVLAVLACPATQATTDSAPQPDADGETDTGSETDTSSELGPETEGESGTPEPDMAEELVPCTLAGCPFGTACVEDECVEIAEATTCVAPLAVTLPQPSANGRVVALDLVDLQQDGDDEIVAWIDEVGIGVLDDGQWTKSEYLEATNSGPSIAAIHADDDTLLDVLLNDGGNPVRLGLGDGTGSFAIAHEFSGLESLRGIGFAPDHRRAFGLRAYAASDDQAAYLRFDNVRQPTVIELAVAAQGLLHAQLDAAAPDDVVFHYRCEAYASRVYADGDIDARQVQLDYQPLTRHQSVGHCSWASADFDGDGRDELVARELLHYSWDLPQAMLLTVLPNTTEIDAGLPSFDAPWRTRIPNPHALAAGGDVDGDGDDELLLTRSGVDGGGTLVWAGEGQLVGCMASLPTLPSEPLEFRMGDVDGDGDDEVVLFRENGALQVLDFQ